MQAVWVHWPSMRPGCRDRQADRRIEPGVWIPCFPSTFRAMSDERIFSVQLAGAIMVNSHRLPTVGPAGELTVDWPDDPPVTVVYAPHAWVSFTYDTPAEHPSQPIGT